MRSTRALVGIEFDPTREDSSRTRALSNRWIRFADPPHLDVILRCPPDANVGVRRSERTLLRSRIRKLPRPEIYRAADAGPRNAPNPRRSLNLAGSSSICSLESETGRGRYLAT